MSITWALGYVLPVAGFWALGFFISCKLNPPRLKKKP